MGFFFFFFFLFLIFIYLFIIIFLLKLTNSAAQNHCLPRQKDAYDNGLRNKFGGCAKQFHWHLKKKSNIASATF